MSRFGFPATGASRAPTPACTRTATSGASASWSWNRSATRHRERSRHFALAATPRSASASWANSRCGNSSKDGKQPLDPDGNPDTSFLAKIPADVAWTFQTLDNNGMVLNMAQTWHQVRPGEIRNDCGGCHAHSQQPTPFEKTAAARPDYQSGT